MTSFLRPSVLAVSLLLGACVRELPLDERPCPCASGYQCCNAVCVASSSTGEACSAFTPSDAAAAETSSPTVGSTSYEPNRPGPDASHAPGPDASDEGRPTGDSTIEAREAGATLTDGGAPVDAASEVGPDAARPPLRPSELVVRVLSDFTNPRDDASMTSSAAVSINNKGVIAGRCWSQSKTQPMWRISPCIWENGLVGHVEGPGAPYAASAAFIDDEGNFVGGASYQDASAGAIYYDAKTSAITQLAGLLNTGRYDCGASAMNHEGVIVGSCKSLPVVWSTPTEQGQTPSLGTAVSGSVAGVNDAGTMVGTLHFDTHDHAVIWDHNVVDDLHSRLPDAVNSVGVGIAPDGTIVGTFTVSTDLLTRSFVLARGRLTTFEEPQGVIAVHAVASADIWVGEVMSPTKGSHAGLWYEGKLFVLPDPPGSKTSRALGVNSAGWVVGSSQVPQNGLPNTIVDRAVVWEPPLASSMLP